MLGFFFWEELWPHLNSCSILQLAWVSFCDWISALTHETYVYKNLIIRNLKWTNQNVKLKHVMDLGIGLDVSLDFLFSFLFSFQAKPWLWIVPTLINPTNHITLVNPVQKNQKYKADKKNKNHNFLRITRRLALEAFMAWDKSTKVERNLIKFDGLQILFVRLDSFQGKVEIIVKYDLNCTSLLDARSDLFLHTYVCLYIYIKSGCRELWISLYFWVLLEYLYIILYSLNLLVKFLILMLSMKVG